MSRAALALLLLAAAAGTFGRDAAAGGEPPAATAPASGPMPPREAGARYGQAMGAELVCYGVKATEAAGALGNAYSGDDATLFRAEADKVLQSWRDALSCKGAGGPNECRLIHEFSCRDAIREIGPAGSRVQGLLAPRQ